MIAQSAAELEDPPLVALSSEPVNLDDDFPSPALYHSPFPTSWSSRPEMMNRVPPQAQTYGFPPGGQPQQRAMTQPLEPQQQNKGTLVPGQVLRVGKIQVTVERYLSEGTCSFLDESTLTCRGSRC